MNWIQFRSVCRQYKNLPDQHSQQVQINQHMGQSEPYSELASTLHDRLSGIPKGERNRAAEIYSRLNVHRNLQENTQFKRAFLYMAYVSVVFIFMFSIYQFLVQPSLQAMLQMLMPDDWNEPSFALSNVLPTLLAILVFGYLTIAFWVAFTLRKIQRFKDNATESWVFRHLIFPSIRRHYRHVLDLLYYPILSSEAKGHANNWITKHLCELDRDDYPIHEEINDILESETQALNDRCEQQMRWMAVILGVFLAFSIALFLVSAYSPIFMTGNIL
jgi:hypothetical protein